MAALRRLREPASEWRTRTCAVNESASPSPRGPGATPVPCLSLCPSTRLARCPTTSTTPFKTSSRCSTPPLPHPSSPSHLWRSPGHLEGHGEQAARARLSAQWLSGPTAPGGDAVGLQGVFQPSPIRSADSSVQCGACTPLPPPLPSCLACPSCFSFFRPPASLSGCFAQLTVCNLWLTACLSALCNTHVALS